jgi:hypothetical protein
MAIRAGFQGIGLIVHRAALAGRVLDQLAGASLPGAEVVITDAPPAFWARTNALKQGRPSAQPERVIADGNGFFHFDDLPAGAYALSATLPGGGTRYAAAAIGNATVAAQGTATVDLALTPTALTGVVMADAPAGPLALARVRLVDTSESTFTADDGSYTLSPVEQGSNRTLEFSAQRYGTAKQSVTLMQGKTTAASMVTLVHT